jgi:hypothetical protein
MDRDTRNPRRPRPRNRSGNAGYSLRGSLGRQWSHQESNGDGKPDLVLHFDTQETGIRCGDTSAALAGRTFGGQDIAGSDSIQTVGCH